VRWRQTGVASSCKRLRKWAADWGIEAEVVAEVGSGLNGKRRKLLRALRDPAVGLIVVEHRDRLSRFGFDLVEAALLASSRRVAVLEQGEVADDLVRDVLEVLTSLCARLYGRRSAKNRAKRALEAIQGDVHR
jgi:putative resolvase